MKRFFFIISTLCFLVSCNSTPEKKTMEQLESEINQYIDEIYQDLSLTDDQKEEKELAYFETLYNQHLNDTLDVELFTTLMVSLWDLDQAKAQFEIAPECVKNDQSTVKRLNVLENQANTVAGNSYIEINGVDAVTGEPTSLSQIIKSDKPTLLDFWASWCSPCRKEISNNLKDLAASGEVNIIGIAVWEDGIEDTQKAMEDLGITWPVIFNGGRENSISQQYGVIGIPTLFLLSPDGKFMESAHSIEDMEFFK